MKSILLLAGMFAVVLLGSHAQASIDASGKTATKVFDTQCIAGDCLQAGWVTTGANGYRLVAQCKIGDCAEYGWHSDATDGSHFDVSCLAGGCFTRGWDSVEYRPGAILHDSVVCKSGGCLVGGWKVANGSGGSSPIARGNVTCTNRDCAHNGGLSNWRGKKSRTTCYDNDCYYSGWKLEVF